jgi:hypothetical protein
MARQGKAWGRRGRALAGDGPGDDGGEFGGGRCAGAEALTTLLRRALVAVSVALSLITVDLQAGMCGPYPPSSAVTISAGDRVVVRSRERARMR